jgi:hypothetical protein
MLDTFKKNENRKFLSRIEGKECTGLTFIQAVAALHHRSTNSTCPQAAAVTLLRVHHYHVEAAVE